MLVIYFQIVKDTGVRPKDYRLRECHKKFADKQKECAPEPGSVFKVDRDTFKE